MDDHTGEEKSLWKILTGQGQGYSEVNESATEWMGPRRKKERDEGRKKQKQQKKKEIKKNRIE